MATAAKQGKRPAPNGEEYAEEQQATASHKRPRYGGSGGRARKKKRESTDLTDTTAIIGSSPLLDLPAELRNDIYEYVAINSGAALHRRTKGKLASGTALCRVSKQVRDEYQAVLYISAPIIDAHVKNFDFSHIVTFLNKLSERELSALPTLNSPTHRKLRIHLEITRECPQNPEGLQKWLVRREHPTKKGKRINVEYTASGDQTVMWVCGQIDGAAYYVHHRLAFKLVQLEDLEGGREDRVYQELSKVLKAIRRDCHV
ncbi:hypothetical protein LTR85_003419 [Meristemomyces frigidus]|nr:hypothetical protein LTR85_003419 [Meristemomyces frigidus]